MDVSLIRTLCLVALVVPGTFFVGLGELLTKSPSSRVAAGIVIISATVGVCGYLAGHFDELTTVIFAYPAYQLATFRLLHLLFLKAFGREPKTAAFNFASEIAADRVFALAVLVISTFGPVFLIAWLSRPH